MKRINDRNENHGRRRSRARRRVTAAAALGLACAVVASCAPPPEEDEPSSDEPTEELQQAIRGGALADDLAPAVIQLRAKNGGGLCTAVMITDQFFVTARHCTNGEPVNFGGFMRMPVAADGRALTREVERIETFGEGRNTDLAIGKLAEPVPWVFDDPSTGRNKNQFKPGWLAPFPAVNGKMVTSYGFGQFDRCWERNAKIDDHRRFKQWRVGEKDPLCPGDSGGPTFLGKLVDPPLGAPIISLTSAARPLWQFKDWLLQKLRRTAGGVEPGLDRFGMDYRTVSVEDPSACHEVCRLDSQCRAFTFQNGSCFLKKAAQDATPCRDCVSGVPTFAGFDALKGGELATISNGTIDGCETACAQDRACFAWTFDLEDERRSCVLRDETAVRDFEPRGFMLSGWRRGFEPDTVRSGSPFKTVKVADRVACADQCMRNGTCRAWSYEPKKKSCVLQRYETSSKPQTGTTSGLRQGMEYDTARTGEEWKQVKATDPVDCQTKCYVERRCWAWTYTPSNRSERDKQPLGDCSLQALVTEPVFAIGKVAGRKGMETFGNLDR